MRLIVGLGNPGKKYEKTRHNVGFRVLDKIAEDLPSANFHYDQSFKSSVLTLPSLAIFIKPQTYMNLSGGAVEKIMDYYRIDPGDFLVISDDINLPLGTIRLRREGSSGGHQGLQSIIDHFGEEYFARLRIGIGRNPEIPSKKYVLRQFKKNEEKILNKVIDQVAKLVLEFIENGIEEKTIKIM